MYEELIKSLRMCGSPTVYSDCITFHDGSCEAEPICMYELMEKAADAIEELQKQKWIPVTERLPETFKHVLVNIPGMTPHPTVQEAFFEKDGMWYSNGFQYSAEEITHWMPLPEPPKEGA